MQPSGFVAQCVLPRAGSNPLLCSQWSGYVEPGVVARVSGSEFSISVDGWQTTASRPDLAATMAAKPPPKMGS
jgi:hypothetical protein